MVRKLALLLIALSCAALAQTGGPPTYGPGPGSASGGSGAPDSVTEKTETATYTSVSGDFSGATTPPTEVIFTISSTTQVIWKPPSTAPALVSSNMPCVIVENSAASVPYQLVVESNGLTLDGTNYSSANSVGIDPGKGVEICSDGTNYHVSRGTLSLMNPTEGTDGIWNNGMRNMVGAGSVSTGIPVLGTGYVSEIVPDHDIPVGHATMYLSTTQASAIGYACIYTGTSTGAVWSASITLSGTSGTAATGSATQYVLLAGVHYYVLVGQFGSSTGATVSVMPTQGTGLLAILAAQGTWFSTSANGVNTGPGCPTSTGTLTSITSASSVFPIVLLGP